MGESKNVRRLVLVGILSQANKPFRVPLRDPSSYQPTASRNICAVAWDTNPQGNQSLLANLKVKRPLVPEYYKNDFEHHLRNMTFGT